MRWHVAIGAVCALTAYGAADALDLVPGVLTTERHDTTSTARMMAGQPPPLRSATDDQAAQVALPLVVDGVRVLDPAAGEPATPAAVARALTPLLRAPALGPSVSVLVRDAASGHDLLTVNPQRPRTPASSAKLLAGFAVATQADLGERAPTRVVAGPQRGQITLVAGGDTLLATGAGSPHAVIGRAGLADLADQVASVLTTHQQPTAALALDLRLAAGPAYGPQWEPADIQAGLTGPVSMLGLAQDMARPGRPAPADPALAAGQAFRSALLARGISVPATISRVAGPTTSRAPATSPAPGTAAAAADRSGDPSASGSPDPLAPGQELGRVEGAPLGRVLALAMATSDNALTETLSRRVAASHQVPTTFPAVGAWVRAQVVAAGVDVTGLTLVDASGLSRSSTVTARTLVDVLALAEQPTYRDGFAQVVADLPVSGLSGTLQDRYRSGVARAAAGIVRAKTGTLTGVASLAGTLVDADGRLVQFAVLADQAPPPPVGGMERTRAALDEVVAALARCGCR